MWDENYAGVCGFTAYGKAPLMLSLAALSATALCGAR
jgi:hypothetical protein